MAFNTKVIKLLTDSCSIKNRNKRKPSTAASAGHCRGGGGREGEESVTAGRSGAHRLQI